MPERALNNRTSNYQNVSAHDQSRQHNGDNFYHNGDNFYGNVTFQHTLAAPATPSIAPGYGYIDFLETLKFEQMDSRYMTVQSQLLGTCKWILDTPEYKTWLDPEMVSTHHGFLWIKGKAGAGKSTIMKFASESTQARCVNRQHVLSFFFSARAGSMETSVNGLFRSLLYQLVNKVPGLYGMLDKRRLDLVKRQGWTPVLLKATFEDAVLKLTEDSVTCFIDAMDECRAEDVQDIISYFDNLGDSLTVHPGLLRVCLSSRIYPNLKSIRSVELVLEKQSGHEKDIRTYIDRRLIVDSKYLKRNLGNIIERKARGVFMWVVLVISLLNKEDRGGNAHMMHKRLEQMPAGLSDLIDDLLERGPRNPFFRPLLQLTTFAAGQLHLSPRSIYSALRIGMSVTGNDEMDINPSSSESQTHEKFILDASKGLLEVVGVGNSARVQHIHESVRTYFMNEGLKYFTSKDGREVNRVIKGETSNSQIDTFETLSTRCHHDLMRFCIRYVEAAVEIEMATPEQILNYQWRLMGCWNKEEEPFPFLSYVQPHFWEHVEKAWKGRSRQKVCLESIPTKVLDVLVPPFLSKDVGDAHLSKEPLFKVACVLTYKDISTILSVVLEAMSASGLEQRGLHYLLSISVRENSQGCTSVLLQAGADPNAKTQPGVPLLNHALRERRLEVVKQLLDAGARPHGISDEQVDSLYDECARRESRELLLREHLVAESDYQFMTYSSACALGQAVFRGEKELSITLAEKGMKFGLWSYTVVDDEASDTVTLELEAKDEAIAARIQGQAPAVRRSLHNKTKLLMRLEKRAQELEAQTIGGLIEAIIS